MRWCGAALAEADKILGIYNCAAYWAGRVRLMQRALIASTACATVRLPFRLPFRCADRRSSLLSLRPSAAKRDIHPRCRDRSWSYLPSCTL